MCAEGEPISTFQDFGEREFLVADERGYEHLLYKMAGDFLFTSEGKLLDNRLKFNKVQESDPPRFISLSFYYYSNNFSKERCLPFCCFLVTQS